MKQRNVQFNENKFAKNLMCLLAQYLISTWRSVSDHIEYIANLQCMVNEVCGVWLILYHTYMYDFETYMKYADHTTSHTV